MTGYVWSCPTFSAEPASTEFPARNFIGFEFNGNASLKSDKIDSAAKLGLAEAQGCSNYSDFGVFKQFVNFGKFGGPKLVSCRVEAGLESEIEPFTAHLDLGPRRGTFSKC